MVVVVVVVVLWSWLLCVVDNYSSGGCGGCGSPRHTVLGFAQVVFALDRSGTRAGVQTVLIILVGTRRYVLMIEAKT